MKILIVDDDLKRANKISQFLTNEKNSILMDIEIVSSVNSAKQKLKLTKYNILILDVILPKRADDTANFINGITLLDEIRRRAHYRKPDHIIGITADLDDIEKFKDEFEKHCTLLIPANFGTSEWLEKIENAVKYQNNLLVSSEESEKNKLIITIHGIRTYGHWQNRFRTIVEEQIDNAEFHSYRFGYFATAKFLIPKFRNQQIEIFLDHLRQLQSNKQNSNIYFFAHSFGTYILIKAIEKVSSNKNNSLNINKIVLSGSVLKSNYDFTKIITTYNCIVINDCGTKDNVLLLSDAFVYGTGMAGRKGFTGFSNKSFVNRYFNFGHSGYFTDDTFMKKHWLPLIGKDYMPNEILPDDNSSIFIGLIESVVEFVGKYKLIFYFFLLLLVFPLLIHQVY